MAIPITIPRLGWNMEEGIFSGWLKQDGEAIAVGEPIFRLEGDKAVQDIEALEAGVLRIPAESPQDGDTVAVGTIIGYLAERGETLSEVAPVARQAADKPAGPAARRLARAQAVNLQEVSGSGRGGRITAQDIRGHSPAASTPGEQARTGHPISPRARRIARELGVDGSNLHGSGRTGRILERDVRAAAGPASANVPVGPVRMLIAERMLRSAQSTAPVTLTTSVDATNLVNLRAQFKSAATDAAIPGYTDMLVKLAALTLSEHPHLNARWEADRILLSAAVHIGIAVDTDQGLVAPVVRNVQELGLRQIAALVADLTRRARSRKLRAEEMRDGTFTITNLGMFGIDAFTPIIHYPECAILGVGRILKQPVVVADQIVPRDMITLSLTFDHRLVDGAPAARFLQALVRRIENPGPSLIS